MVHLQGSRPRSHATDSTDNKQPSVLKIGSSRSGPSPCSVILVVHLWCSLHSNCIPTDRCGTLFMCVCAASRSYRARSRRPFCSSLTGGWWSTSARGRRRTPTRQVGPAPRTRKWVSRPNCLKKEGCGYFPSLSNFPLKTTDIVSHRQDFHMGPAISSK